MERSARQSCTLNPFFTIRGYMGHARSQQRLQKLAPRQEVRPSAGLFRSTCPAAIVLAAPVSDFTSELQGCWGQHHDGEGERGGTRSATR